MYAVKTLERENNTWNTRPYYTFIIFGTNGGRRIVQVGKNSGVGDCPKLLI